MAAVDEDNENSESRQNANTTYNWCETSMCACVSMQRCKTDKQTTRNERNNRQRNRYTLVERLCTIRDDYTTLSRRTPPKRDGIQYVIGFRVWCFFLRHYEVAGLNVQPNRWDGRRRVDHVNDSSYSCIPRVYEHVDEHADSRAVRAWAGGLALLFVVASNRFRLACFSCAPTWEGSWRP